MKKFWENNSNIIVKLVITQFGIAVFGLLLDFAANASGNNLFVVAFSVFSTMFYLFLIYTAVWEIGTKDKIKIDAKRMEYSPLKGLLIALFANIPNLIFALFSLIGYIFIDRNNTDADGMYILPKWAVFLHLIAHLIGIFGHSMYLGFVTYIGADAHPLTLFVLVLPAILTCYLAYNFGTKEKFGMLMSVPNKRNK